MSYIQSRGPKGDNVDIYKLWLKDINYVFNMNKYQKNISGLLMKKFIVVPLLRV
jgi:hypothetical protein